MSTLTLAAASGSNSAAEMPGRSGTPSDGDLRLADVGDDAGDDRLFHAGLLIGDPRARLPGEGGADVERNVVVAGELDAAQGQHLAAGAGHLEHLVEVDVGQLAGLRHDARVGGEHAGDVGVDLARVGAERLRRAPTAVRSLPPRPSVVISLSVLTPWKPATTHDLALGERLRGPGRP